MADLLIASIPKNSREELRISRSDFRGHVLATLRVWYQPDDDNEMRPGKQGVAFKIDKLPAVIDALNKLAADART